MAVNKGGRPRKHIDQTQFEKLCGLQCTLEEFCCYFDCNTDTLEKWCKRTYKMGFSEIFRIKKGSGKISLRRRQFELALAGNPTMLVWLGRNMLGQTDKDPVTTELSKLQIEYIKAKVELLTGADTSTLDKLDEILKEMKSNADIESETE